jgi:hypothetical protein
MTDFSGFSEQEILEHIFKNNPIFTSPTEVYVSLHTADEGENPDESNEVDTSTTNYSRAEAVPSDWSIGAGDGPTTLQNANTISFGDPDSNWGTVTHIALWDAQTGGNPLTATVALNSSKSVTSDTDELQFAAGNLTFDLN